MANAKLSLSSPRGLAGVTLQASMWDNPQGALLTREALLSLCSELLLSLLVSIFKKLKMYDAFDLLSVQNSYCGSFLWT